jgi:hypothetical protein
MNEQLKQRLEWAGRNANGYIPNARAAESIENLGFVGIIGPAAVGKSHLIDYLTRADERFGKVWSFATRAPRPDDTPDIMRTIEPTDENLEELATKIEDGDVINYAIHPTTLQIYGTLPESYPNTEFALMPTLANSVNQLDNLPFRSRHYIGLVTDTFTYEQFMNSRRMPPHDKLKRLGEAGASLDWMLSQPDDDITLIVNRRRHEKEVAAELIDAVTNPNHIQDPTAEKLAERLSLKIDRLIEEGERWLSA